MKERKMFAQCFADIIREHITFGRTKKYNMKEGENRLLVS